MDKMTRKRKKVDRTPLQYNPEVDPVMVALLRVMPHLDVLTLDEKIRALNFLQDKYQVDILDDMEKDMEDIYAD